MNLYRIIGMPLLLTVALGATSFAETAEDLLRQGNEAFARGDFSGAVDYYERAEERTTDPGLVAFNKAAALYRLGRFREAELHYLRCREDATSYRRARVLYDLGNALLQQAEDRHASLLERAIDSYQKCLGIEETNAELKQSARDNLELARALLVKARKAKEERNSANPDPADQKSPKPPEPSGDPRRNPANWHPGSADPRGATQARYDRVRDAARGEMSSQEQPPPGMGNLPPIPDQDDVAPLSPEDTTAYLRELTARIVRESREQKLRSLASPPPGIKDW